MTIKEAQEAVDQWIKEYGVRYFSELTNMACLTEEVGELARVMARTFGLFLCLSESLLVFLSKLFWSSSVKSTQNYLSIRKIKNKTTRIKIAIHIKT